MSYLESDAQCPYYKYDKGNVLHCEIGRINLSDSDMKKEIAQLCIRNMGQCPFKRALDNYYDRFEK